MQVLPVVISTLDQVEFGHTGCRMWITVQTYINDILRCGPYGFKLRSSYLRTGKAGWDKAREPSQTIRDTLCKRWGCSGDCYGNIALRLCLPFTCMTTFSETQHLYVTFFEDWNELFFHWILFFIFNTSTFPFFLIFVQWNCDI